MVFLNILILLVGIVALIKGADWFVDGISSLINPVTVNAASLCDMIILIYVADMIFAIMR